MRVLAIGLSGGGVMGDNTITALQHLAKRTKLSAVLPLYLKGKMDNGADPAAALAGTAKVHTVYLTLERQKIGGLLSAKNFRALVDLRKQKFDIVYYLNLHPMNVFIRFLLRGCRHVYLWHDPFLHGRPAGAGLKYRLMELMQRFHDRYMTQYSDAIIVTSERMKQDILQQSNYCKLSRKIAVSYLGLLHNFQKIRERAIGADKPEDIDLLFFGRITSYKGLDNLHSAVELLNSKGKKIKVVAAGPGDWEKEYPGLKINFLELINRYVSDEELAGLISASKIIVLPYKDATGTQTVQLAYLFSKPVIGTSVGCFPEYILHNQTGILVEPDNSQQLAEAVEYLLDHPYKREFMGIEGQRYLINFDNDRLTDNLVTLFGKLLESDGEKQ